jgi:transcriptional regulator with XRE-family HTH domain
MIPESDIGSNIRKIRKSKRLTLDKLAGKSGISKGYLSKVENSDKSPPVSTLINIAEKVGKLNPFRSSRKMNAKLWPAAALFSGIFMRPWPITILTKKWNPTC